MQSSHCTAWQFPCVLRNKAACFLAGGAAQGCMRPGRGGTRSIIHAHPLTVLPRWWRPSSTRERIRCEMAGMSMNRRRLSSLYCWYTSPKPAGARGPWASSDVGGLPACVRKLSLQGWTCLLSRRYSCSAPCTSARESCSTKRWRRRRRRRARGESLLLLLLQCCAWAQSEVFSSAVSFITCGAQLTCRQVAPTSKG